MPEKDWSIWLEEVPVVASIKKDVELFGKALSHPFLSLKDPFDQTVAKIHATRGNWPSRGLRDKPGKMVENFAAAVCGTSSAYVIAKAAWPVYPLAILHSLCGKIVSHPNNPKQQLCSGKEKNMLELWYLLHDAVPELNAYRLPFFRYAERGSGLANCQVMLRATLERTGIVDDIPPLQMAQTGWTPPVKTAINHVL